MRRTRERGKRLALAKGLRFTCRQCGDCCRDFPVALSPAEVERYEARDWSPIVGEHGLSVVEPASHGGRGGVYLKRRADGACIFLGEDDLCEVHRHFGEPDKPLTCRAFPFAFLAGSGGEGAFLGAQFACSAIAAGEGRPVAPRRRELEGLLGELDGVWPLPAGPDPVPFDRRRSFSRGWVEVLFDEMVALLEDAGRPFPDRILAVAHLVRLVSGSSAASLEAKMLKTFAKGVHEQSRRGILRPPAEPPRMPERILFRQLLALAARRDPGRLLTVGVVRRSVRRFGNLVAGLAFLSGGGGFVPVGRERRVALGAVLREAPAADPASPEADGALTRYFVAHLSGRRLLAPDFQVPQLLPALGVLLRQYPAVLVFARAACAARGGEAVSRDDYAAALRTADWTFGHVPWTRGPVGRVRAGLFADVEAALTHVPHCAGRASAGGAATGTASTEPGPPQRGEDGA